MMKVLLLITLLLLFSIVSFTKKSASKKTFDLSWKYGEIDYKKCKERKSPALNGICGDFQDVVEEVFDEQGRSLQDVFINSYSKTAEVAERPKFAKEGGKTLDDTLDWIIEEEVTDLVEMKGKYTQNFFRWFAEILKEADKPGTGFANQIPEGFNFDQMPPPPRRQKGEL